FQRVGAELGIPVLQAPLRRPWRLAGLLALRRWLRREPPDVLHFACGKSLLVAGVAALGVPIRLRIAIRRLDHRLGRAPWKAVRYRRLTDHTIAICASIRRHVVAMGVPPERVHLVHDGIEVERWLG